MEVLSYLHQCSVEMEIGEVFGEVFGEQIFVDANLDLYPIFFHSHNLFSFLWRQCFLSIIGHFVNWVWYEVQNSVNVNVD